MDDIIQTFHLTQDICSAIHAIASTTLRQQQEASGIPPSCQTIHIFSENTANKDFKRWALCFQNNGQNAQSIEVTKEVLARIKQMLSKSDDRLSVAMHESACNAIAIEVARSDIMKVIPSIRCALN